MPYFYTFIQNRGESISLFFQLQNSQELTVVLFKCKESLTLAKGIKENLEKIGIEGKHTDTKKRTALQNAKNLIDLASIKIQNIEQGSSECSGKEVEEVMAILRDAAENYAYCDDSRHADVLQMLHRFLNLDTVKQILSQDLPSEKDTCENVSSSDQLPSKDDIQIEISPETSSVPDDASTHGSNNESKSPGDRNKSVPPPDGEVLEATPCMLFDDDDEHLQIKSDGISRGGDKNSETGSNEQIASLDTVSAKPGKVDVDDGDDAIEDGLISSELNDFLKQADAELESIMQS